jgi:hypothetical protein
LLAFLPYSPLVAPFSFDRYPTLKDNDHEQIPHNQGQ